MGDIIKLSSPATKQYWEIPVLFEDGDLLVLDKPSDLPAVQSYSDVETVNLLALLRRDIENNATWVRSRPQIPLLDILYILDPETTGVLAFTKTKIAHDFLANFLGSEKPFRVFHTLVHGVPREPSIKLNAGITPHPARHGLMKVDVKRGKKAITHFSLLESFNHYSYLQCTPITDRFAQIRAHLRYIKCPIVCDTLYFGKPLYLSSIKPKYHPSRKHDERPLIARTALHCSEIRIPHPSTGEQILIEAPLAKDINVALKMLRRYDKQFSSVRYRR